MGNNEYSRRKYSPGDGAKRGGRERGKKGWGTGRKNENLLAGYLGWTPVSSHVRKPRAHHLSSSTRAVRRPSAPSLPIPPSFYLIRVEAARGNFHGASLRGGRTKHRFRLKRNNDPGSNRPSPLIPSLPFEPKPANIL